jgi:hypothetical protein
MLISRSPPRRQDADRDRPASNADLPSVAMQEQRLRRYLERKYEVLL